VTGSRGYVRELIDGSGAISVPKENLLRILRKLLDCELDLGFLRQIEERDLEQLLVAIRIRMEKER
jgi:hypothetical protein